MKSFLKLFSAYFLGVFILSLGVFSYAATSYKPDDAFIPGTDCPAPPNPAYAVICGVVKSSVPRKVSVSVIGGTEQIWKPHQPVEGVSVYIYECDNLSASCKKQGNLVNPFSSTVTDKDGKFYLLMRKLDNFYEVNPADKTAIQRNVMSKKRYIVFNCGATFAGMQVIPSYLDQTSFIQEVQCAKASYAYQPMMDTYELAKGDRYANTMGTDDSFTSNDTNGITNSPPPGSEGYFSHLTSQVAFKDSSTKPFLASNGLQPLQDNSPTVSTNFDLGVKGADPRFNKDNDLLLIQGANTLTGGNDIQCPAGQSGCSANLGAYWSRDCWKIYGGTASSQYCMKKSPAEANVAQVYVNEDLVADRLSRIKTYNDGLIGKDTATYTVNNSETDSFVIQNKLPNIPPKEVVMFYKELPVRQDVVECIQDPTDIAKYLNLTFSNCIGKVNLRREGEIRTTKEKYMSCETLKACSRRISSGVATENSDGKEYINSFTTSSFGVNLQNPFVMQNMYDNGSVNGNVPICTTETGTLIKLGQIQPPWELPNPEIYALDSTYWSPELVIYFGKNNTLGKEGIRFFGNNDSYDATAFQINREYFKATQEAAGVPQQGGTYCTYQSGGKKPNNAVAAAIEISTNKETGSSDNALVNVITSPIKGNVPEYSLEIQNGTKLLSGGKGFARLGQISNVNPLSERLTIGSIINGLADDFRMLSNVYFKGNPNHYPTQSLYTLVPGLPNTTVVDYAKSIGCKYYYESNDNQWLECDNVKYTFNQFITKYSAILKNSSVNQYEQSFQDGFRTAETSIFITSAADKRIKALSNKSNKASDLYDSFLSTQIGRGFLNLELNILSFVDGIRTWLASFTDSTEQNKNFLDRKNAAKEALGTTPGLMDDLHSTFPLSEESFLKFFKLPKTPDEGGEIRTIQQFNTSDWGPGHTCYPWNNVETGQKCNTDATEAKESASTTGICSGPDCRNPISRTCRLDTCQRDTFNINCKCTRNAYVDPDPAYTFPATGQVCYYVYYSYASDCTTVSDISKLSFKVNSGDCDVQDRYTCAKAQLTCQASESTDERSCLVTEYINKIQSDLNSFNNNPNSHPCGPEQIPLPTDNMVGPNRQLKCVTTTIPYVPAVIVTSQVPVSTIPSCTMSKAGPYVCSGDLTKDSEFKMTSQVLRPNENSYVKPSDQADALNEEENEIRKQWSIPQQANLYYAPAQMLSTESSVKATETDAVQIYKRKDTFGVGGDAASAGILRTMFWAPSKADTVAIPTYNNFSIYCNNLGINSTGSWKCDENLPPSPEVVDLKTDLTLSNDSTCNFNPSPQCAALLFGINIETNKPKAEFSESFVKVMSKIGGDYQIPPSVIMAYIGSYDGSARMRSYDYYFSNEGEKDFTDVTAPWYGGFKGCDDMNTASVGPYDWILQWFNAVVQAPDTKIGEFLDRISFGRSKTASRCNFLDATYAVGGSIYSGLPSGKKGSITNPIKCSNINWADVQEALKTLTFGGADSRMGVFETGADDKYAPGGVAEQIFNACRFLQ